MKAVSSFIKDLSTGIDGESYDVGRVLLVVGALAFIGLSVYAVVTTGVFDPLNWGGGYGGLLAGGGAAISLKAKTEPGPDQ